MRSFLHSVPIFLPGVAFFAVLGVLVSSRLARSLGSDRATAFALFLSVGIILAATLTPNIGGSYASSAVGHCDLSRMWVPPVDTLLRDRDAALNVVLFVPLGLALGLLPRTAGTAALITAFFGLTVMVELAQLVLGPLGRECETADVVDNTVGLVIGLAIGTIVAYVRDRSRSGPAGG